MRILIDSFLGFVLGKYASVLLFGYSNSSLYGDVISIPVCSLRYIETASFCAIILGRILSSTCKKTFFFDEPTDSVSQIVVVKKADDNLRMCIDPQSLNNAFLRERYPLSILEDILPKLERHVSQKLILSAHFGASNFWHVIRPIQMETSTVWS